MSDGPRTPLVDLRAPGALLQFAADLARAHAGALMDSPVTVIAVKRQHLRLVKDSAPGIRSDPSSGAFGVGNEPGTGAECVVCDDAGCPYCPKVGA